jgi:hypothetical protein
VIELNDIHFSWSKVHYVMRDLAFYIMENDGATLMKQLFFC